MPPPSRRTNLARVQYEDELDMTEFCHRASQSRTRGHTTKIILWGSHSSIVISRRHTGEATTNTTSQTSTLVGANLCLLIPKPKSLATATFHNAPF